MAETSVRNSGTSPAVTITAEELDQINYHHITDVNIDGVNPPGLAQGAALSEGIEMWQQPWLQWNGEKITEPKFDGIAQSLGMISNIPDYIKDYHFIGLMRLVNNYLKPEIRTHIFVEAHSPRPAPPIEGLG